MYFVLHVLTVHNLKNEMSCLVSILKRIVNIVSTLLRQMRDPSGGWICEREKEIERERGGGEIEVGKGEGDREREVG